MILKIRIMIANFESYRNCNNVWSIIFIFIYNKILNRKQFIEIDIMISYSYKNIVVSIILTNLLQCSYMLLNH